MTDPIPDSRQPPEPLVADRLLLYVTILIGQFVLWYSLVLFWPMLVREPGLGHLYEIGMAYVFVPPAIVFAIVFTLQANRRVFKTYDVVIVLVVLVVLTTVNLFTMYSVMPTC
jgi:hypothetical protein